MHLWDSLEGQQWFNLTVFLSHLNQNISSAGLRDRFWSVLQHL